MSEIKLSKEILVKLVGLKKCKETFPDLFKDEEAMHMITDEDAVNMISIAKGDMAPASKYDEKCFILNPDYHWTIIKRTNHNKWTTYLVPVKKEYSKQNPIVKRTYKKRAAPSKKRGPYKKRVKTDE